MRISDWSSDVCSSDLPAPEAEPAGDDRFVDRPHALAVRHAGTPGDARAAARGADDGAAAVVDEAFVAWNQRDRFAERIATHRRVAERAERARPHLHAHVQADQFIAAGVACAVEQAQQAVQIETPAGIAELPGCDTGVGDRKS